MSGFFGGLLFPSRVSRTQKQEAIVSHQQIGGLSAQIDPTNTQISIYSIIPKIRIFQKESEWKKMAIIVLYAGPFGHLPPNLNSRAFHRYPLG